VHSTSVLLRALIALQDSIGTLFRNQRNFEYALNFYKEPLDLSEKHFSKDDRLTAFILMNIA